MKHHANLLGRFTVILVMLVQLATASGIGLAQSPNLPAATPSASGGLKGGAPQIAPAFTQTGTLPLGFQYARSFGITGQPYPANGQNAYLNHPTGVTLDGSGHLYAVENNGERLWGFNTSSTPGTPLSWAPYGIAGVNGKPGSDTVMNNPYDIYANPDGKLWVTNWNYITLFDPVTGTVIDNVQNFNNPDNLPYQNAPNFDCIQGLAMDQTATPMRLFVAETCNYNEVLVFDVTNPYDSVNRDFKLTAVIQAGFWNPWQIKLANLDGAGTKLFLAYDGGLKAFSETTPGANDWAQTAEFNNGNGLRGLALNPTDPSHIFAAGQGQNGPGIQRCDVDLHCDYYIYGQRNNQPNVLWDPFSLVFDSGGGFYVTDQYQMTIQYFSGPNGTPVTFYGTPFKPYDTPLVPDPDGKYYYNNPSGVAVDSHHNVYILEQNGARLTKLGPDGAFIWSFGVPGVNSGNGGNDSTSNLNWPQGSPAVDSLGRIYIPDRNNNRVVILDSDGSFLGFIGQQNTPNYQFDCPNGVAIGPNGDIFVVDNCANNVQVYNSDRYFRSSIGVKWSDGSDNSHFSQPRAITVVDQDTVLVADSNNARIQKCTRSYGAPSGLLAPNTFNESWTCSTFAGATFDRQNDNYHFDWINSLVWDGANKRLYTSEDWRNCFKVFDENGKLITVVGDENNSGTDNYHFSTVTGLAVDPSGNVYAVDQNNYRVQKFVPTLSPIEFAGQTGGTMDYITGDGTHVYASQGAQLKAYDITGPQPALLGTSDLLPATLIANPVLTSGAVFALLGDNTLRSFSLADPAHLTQEGSLPIISPVALGGLDGWLFTVSCCGWGSGWNGPRLYAIDAHDPANPAIKGWITLDPFTRTNDWYVEKIEVALGPGGTYRIFMAAHQAGVVQVSFDPANPPDKVLYTVQQFTDGGNQFMGLALSADGNTVYAVDHPQNDSNGHLHILDAGPMGPKGGPNPNQIDTNLTDEIVRFGGALYLHDHSNLGIYNLTGTLLSTYNSNQPDTYFRKIYGVNIGVNNWIYDAADTAGLLTFNVLPLADPPLNLTSRIKTPSGGPGLLEGIGTTIYDATWEGGLRIMDASNPSAMIETFHGITDSVVNRVATGVIDGQTYAFMLVGAGPNVQALEVSNVASPDTILADSQGIIGEGATFGGSNALLVRPGAAHHARVYVPGANGCLYAYDVDFGSLPDVTISLANKSAAVFNGYVHGAAFYGNYLLASADNDGVHIFVSILSTPSQWGLIDKINPNSIVVVGNTAYYTDYKNGLVLVDLSDIAHKNWPVIGKFWIPYYPGYLSVKAFGSKVYAYVPGGNGGLRVLDVSDPGNIVLITTTGPAGAFEYTAYVNGNFLYESSVAAGLYAYWAPPFTQANLTSSTDLLDSSAIDGVTYHLNAAPPEALALVHMPVYSPNAPVLPGGAQAAGHTFAVFARSSATDQPVTTLGPGQTYTVAVHYTPAELNGMAESTLGLYSWNGSSWVYEPTSVVNTSTHTLTATPNHFSLWSLFGWLPKAAPTGALAFDPSSLYTTTTHVNLAITYSPDTWQMRLRQSPAAWGPWIMPAAAPTFDLTTGDGLKTVEAQLKDLAGNVTTLSAQITLDSTPPTGAINFGGVSLTNLTPLNLTVSASDTGSGISKMRFSEKADFSDAPVWLDYATSATFAPSAGDGPKTVYAEFTDVAGNQTSVPISASTTVDQTPPTGSLYINSGASVTTVPGVMLTLAASDNLSGPAKMRFSASADFTGIAWLAYTPTSAYTLAGPDGSNTVYAQVQDAAGNTSPMTILASILLDSTAPDGSVTINLKPFTTTPSVNLALASTGAVTMRISNRSDFSGASWEAFAATKAWTLSAGDGSKTVYAQFQDNHANLSAVFSDTTLLDSTPPTALLYINDGAAVTAVPGVTLTLAASDGLSGPAKMRFNTTSDFTGVAWQTYVPSQAFTLTGPDGSKNVYAQVQDTAGNISTATIVATIVLDTTPPSGSVTINLKPFTITPSVNLALSATGAATMRISNTSDFSGVSWEAFAASKAWTLIAGDGSKSVYVQFQDNHGNLSPVYSDSTMLDTTPPTGSLYINGGAAVTFVPGVTLTLAASDGLSGPAKMRFSASADFTGIAWKTYAPSQAFTLAGPDGSKNVYAQVQDAAGNISTATILATIVLDTTTPAGGVSIDLKPFTTSAAVNLTLTSAGAATMRVSNNSSFPGADSAWVPFAGSKAWALTSGNGPKTVFAQFKDANGNLSPVYSDSTLLDATAPTGQLYINGGAAVTAVPAVKLFNTFTETGSGVSQYRVAGTSGGLATAAWQAFVNPADYTLPAGDGVKTVWIQLKDAAGNLSAAFSDTITLDGTAPSGSVVIDSGAVSTFSWAVTLSLGASDALAPQAALQMQVSNDSGFSGAAWQPFQSSLPWTLLPGLGSHTVYVHYRDAAGNVSATYHTQIKVLAAFYIPIVLK